MSNLSKNKDDSEKLFKALEILFNRACRLLKRFNKSTELQKFFYKRIESYAYAQLIVNFFNNANLKNTVEENLPKGQLTYLRKSFKDILIYSKKITRDPFSKQVLRKKDYEKFKKDLNKKYPEFHLIIDKLEEIMSVKNLDVFLYNKSIEISNVGKKTKWTDITTFNTSLIESYIKAKQRFPSPSVLNKLISVTLPKVTPGLSAILHKQLTKDLKDFNVYHSKTFGQFNKRHKRKWGKLLDLLNYYITLSEEAGQKKKDHFIKIKKNSSKTEAIIKIHARSIQIAREIHCLLENGFSDGAFSRWRSLHELCVTSMFLAKSADEFSDRYMDHEAMKAFRNLEDYKKFYKKLGYEPANRKDVNYLKKKMNELKSKYGNDYNYDAGYGWIPKNHLINSKGVNLGRSFKALEEYVGRDFWRPFYNMASDATHAGSKGFYRIGLWDDVQYEVLLTGRTDYGLEDPIQNTILTLGVINNCLISIETNLESILEMEVFKRFSDDIKYLIAKSLKRDQKENVA